MLLDLGFKFKDLDGNEIKDSLPASTLLAQCLIGKAEGISAIKAYDWALELHKKGQVELDRTDLESLEKYIEKISNDGMLTTIVAAPVLLAIKKLKE